MKQSSVDILVPCYNGERFLNQLFECLLKQTYDNITIIIADDGSTDKSYEIMQLYRDKVEARGYKYIVLHQNNGGLSSAYNLCLTKVSSDYILQIDCDDTIKEDAIEKYAVYLDTHNDIGYVRSNGWMHYIDDIERKDDEFLNISGIELSVQEKTDLCIPILTGKAYIAPPCSYMYRRANFEAIYPDRIIDQTRLGQNYQVLLALSFQNKAGYIKEPLFWYTIRKDSLEHMTIDKDKELWRIEESARLIRSVLATAGAPTELWEKYAGMREFKLKLNYAYKYKDKELSRNAYKELKKIEKPSYSDKKNYYSTCYRGYDIIRTLIRKAHLIMVSKR